MLAANNLYIKYGDRVLLDHISLVFNTTDKAGLVGRNGAGKSTILKVLAKEIIPDEGNVTLAGESTIGFLHQEIEIEQSKSVLDEAMTAFEELKKLERQLEKINEEMSTRTDYESDGYLKLLEAFSDVNDRYYLLGGESSEVEAVKILKGLGFKENDFSRAISEFSGGWQMRVVLAKMLLQKPDFLLLDEPTNHLDIESIIWLESFLKNYHSGVILISHDQQFLDNCTNRTVEIELGRIEDYKAPYSKYLELRKDRKEKQFAAFENQQRLIAQKERTITRFMAKATKTKMAQSMKKQLDKLERIEVQEEDVSTMKLRFPPAPRSGEIAVSCSNLNKSYGDLEVLRNIDLDIERGDRVAFVGQNGQGKTTLAKIIMDKLESTSGSVSMGFNVSLGYYAQNQAEILDRNKTVQETMEDHSPPEMRTSLRNILGAFMFSGDDADKKVSVLSGGERARLALACMLLQPINLLVLDEPTNHLDMLSKQVLKNALIDYDGTLIVVSHDRHFLGEMTDKTYEFRDRKIYEHLGDVNYFLEKRKLDNMREVEVTEKKRKKPQTQINQTHKQGQKNKPTIDRAKLKELQRVVENCERKIINLEQDIEKLEAKMGINGFYESTEANDTLQKHAEKKKELDDQFAKWETAQEDLDKYTM